MGGQGAALGSYPKHVMETRPILEVALGLSAGCPKHERKSRSAACSSPTASHSEPPPDRLRAEGFAAPRKRQPDELFLGAVAAALGVVRLARAFAGELRASDSQIKLGGSILAQQRPVGAVVGARACRSHPGRAA